MSVMTPSTGLTVDRVRNYLRSQVGRRWRLGDRLPPIDALAEELGVGRVNTLRAVKMLVQEGYLVSRPRLGTVVIAEIPSPVQVGEGQAASGKPDVLAGRTIRVLASATFDAFSKAAVRSVSHGLRELGATVQTLETHAASPGIVNLTLHDAADAVVAINPGSHCLRGGREDQLLVIITTDADYQIERAGGYDIIGVDSVQGAFLAGRYLRELGAESLGYLGVGEPAAGYDTTSGTRLRGLLQGFGDPPSALYCWHATQYIIEAGARLAAEYWRAERRPDALFAASDELATGFIFGMLGHGQLPGRDYQIMGFDGQMRGRGLQCGPLTTVEVPMERMGRMAVDMLLARFAEPDAPPHRVSVGCTLLPGRTAVPRSA